MITDSTAIPLAPVMGKRDPAAEAMTEAEIVSFLNLLGLIFQSRGNAKAAKIVQMVIPDIMAAWPRYADAIYGPIKTAAVPAVYETPGLVTIVLEWIKSGSDIHL